MTSFTYPMAGEKLLNDDPHPEIRTGALLAAAFFVGFLGWAALTPLDAGAYAEGVIAVSGKRQVVQHRDGGIVNAIRVQEGGFVEKGQVLFQIAASELKANERALAGEVIALIAQRARLVAEREGASSFAEPSQLASPSDEDRPLADEALRGQRLLFSARRDSIGTQKGVLLQRERQLREQMEGHRRQIISNRDQQQLIADELAGMRKLAERGFASTNTIRALERDAAGLDGNFGSYSAEIARLAEGVGETRMATVSLDREMIEDVAQQLRDVQVRLDELQPRLASAREQIARATVRAPASGRVVGLAVFTVGAVVAPGDTLMEIVPQDKDLVVEAMVSPTDADDLRIGQRTQVRFSALHERNLPLLSGVLSKLSADSFVDERTGGRFFKAEIEVPPQELAKIRDVRGNDTGLQAGLPVEIMVPLMKRTVLSYLVEPLTQALWKVGREH